MMQKKDVSRKFAKKRETRRKVLDGRTYFEQCGCCTLSQHLGSFAHPVHDNILEILQCCGYLINKTAGALLYILYYFFYPCVFLFSFFGGKQAWRGVARRGAGRRAEGWLDTRRPSFNIRRPRHATPRRPAGLVRSLFTVYCSLATAGDRPTRPGPDPSPIRVPSCAAQSSCSVAMGSVSLNGER